MSHDPPGAAAAPPQDGPVQRWEDWDYHLMIDAVTDYAIFFLDPEGHVVSWNAGARKIKGYAPDEVIGRHFSMFYPRDVVERGWPAHELQVARANGRFEDEGWRLRKDGSRFWANVILTRVDGPDGQVRGFAKITKDLTERRHQEELLRASEERFRLMVDGVKDYSIFMLDAGGRIMSWNTGAEKNKGYLAGEAIGRHFSLFYPPEAVTAGRPAAALATALREGRFEEEGWRLRKGGERFWANVVITPLHDGAGRHLGFAKITRDLTDKKRISSLEDEGRRISSFLAMLGHELRNPLAAISYASARMGRDATLSEPSRAMHGVISRQLAQITRLVDDLLDVSRITHGKVHLSLAPVRLADVAREAAEAAEPLVHDRGHQLHLEIAPGAESLWVLGDQARLVQVFLNLLTNAAKFTPNGGRIGLVVVARGPEVEMRVKDNGPGIAADVLPLVFNLFVQGPQDAARSTGGLGLGLSLVQQLVTLHGGSISAFSSGRAGEGCEFVVRLPAVAAPAEAAGAGPGLAAPATVRRVLVVDDNRDSADTLTLLLEDLGYRVSVAYDGHAALAALVAQPPDAALLDIGLPGLSGIEVVAQARAALADPPPFVAITGYGGDRDREASLAAGFSAHLTKPVLPDGLAALLQSLLGTPSDPAHEHQDHENQQQQAHAAARPVAPAAAVRPGRDGADEHQDQHDQQHGGQGHGVLLRAPEGGALS